ncbi:hypothetical protein DFI_18890 (plasmid) [Deinococcus ficus]|uniref:Uncharacterized protein n=2 Tax=Deinococcus ficus TaxID=317577 RepID=A0A221T348_9DEIO|nr:hypothetical protein DFI_18890 [Deinococcus ficus]
MTLIDIDKIPCGFMLHFANGEQLEVRSSAPYLAEAVQCATQEIRDAVQRFLNGVYANELI